MEKHRSTSPFLGSMLVFGGEGVERRKTIWLYIVLRMLFHSYIHSEHFIPIYLMFVTSLFIFYMSLSIKIVENLCVTSPLYDLVLEASQKYGPAVKSWKCRM